MSAHAYLPPSGAGAWVECAMWPLMNATYPQDDTPESQEGTAAHHVFEEVLPGGEVLTGSLAPNGVPITEEMQAGGDLYIETIDADLAAAGLTRAHLFVEQRVAIPAISEHNWGTPDTWFFAPTRWTLHVYDYKYGHDFVDAFENWQCVDYASGIIEKLAGHYKMTPAELDQVITVVVTVVQPRNYDSSGPVRRWSVRGSDLRAMWNKLEAAAERALEPNPLATPGAQCEHCPGRHACTPLQRQGYRAASMAGRYAPSPLPPAALAIELAMLEEAQVMLKARIDGLAAEAEARLRRGDAIAGYHLAPKVGREAWNVPATQLFAMARLMGVQGVAKEVACTPKQAIAAGMPAEVVASMSHKPAAGLKLERVTATAAAKVFAKLD